MARAQRGPPILHAHLLREAAPAAAQPARYHDLYSEHRVGPFAGFGTVEEQAELHPLERLLLSHPLTAAPLAPRERRRLRATYYGAQREVDDQLGHLFDYLGVSGLSGGTLVVLTSDHGEVGADHWLVQKCGYRLGWRSRNLERSLADCYLAPGTGPVWGRSPWR